MGKKRTQIEALHRLVEDITPADAEKLLDSLRWKEDDLITNDFGERVWLKPCIFRGKRIGITDCCFEDDPCERHKRLRDEKAAIAKAEKGT